MVRSSLISLSWNEKHTHTKTGTLSWYESDAKDAKIGSVDGYVPKVIDEITFKLMHASETRVDVMCKVAERTDRDRWIEAIKLASIPMKNLKVERMSSKQAKKEKFYVLDERVEAWRRLDNETRDLLYGMLDIDLVFAWARVFDREAENFSQITLSCFNYGTTKLGNHSQTNARMKTRL